MNDVIRQLYDRKSVRAFTDQDIDENIVQEILTAAVMAPTAGNQQLYSIIRITDQEIKDALSESCDHQPFIARGKLVLVFCADCLKWYDAYNYEGCHPRKPGPGDLMIAVDDALIAAQNAVVAAWSYGIGSCYIGDIMENIERQREILGLPDYVFPAALLVFGYPTRQQIERKKPERAALEYIVSENKYRRLNREQLRKTLMKGSEKESYQDWLKAFCQRKYQSDFSVEMSRSVSRYLVQYLGKETSATAAKRTEQAIIFDLDGTLWDSRREVTQVWNDTFKKYPEIDLHLSKDDLDGLMGKTMKEIGDLLFPDREEAFRTSVMDDCGRGEALYLREKGAKLYDGIKKTIARLKESYDLYIVSNCQEGYIEAFLEAHGFTDDFKDYELSGRTGLDKGENIKLLMERNGISRAVYIGDTEGDEQAARQAGIPFIYASYGFGKVSHPDRTVDSLSQLPEAAASLLDKL